MSLTYVRIEGIGDHGRERVVMRAIADVQIGGYAVFRCWSSTDKTIRSGPVLNAYWFEDKHIKKDDWVVLYTKTGRRSEKTENGVTSYFYYWGISSPLWVTVGTAVALVDTPRWTVGQRITEPDSKSALPGSP
jgi:hypothetical protein